MRGGGLKKAFTVREPKLTLSTLAIFRYSYALSTLCHVLS